MKGRQFKSLAEAQAFVERRMQQQNQRPLDEFHGLSPELMYRILHFPFTSPELVLFPDVLDTIRLNFKAVILFLIAGESLAATVGLGYRIFLVRRYLAMDIILPYVVWMSLLALLADLIFRLWIRRRYAWRRAEQ